MGQLDKSGFRFLALVALFFLMPCILVVSSSARAGRNRPSPQVAQATPSFVRVTLASQEVFLFTSGNVQFSVASDAPGTLRASAESDQGALSPVTDLSLEFAAGVTQVSIPVDPALTTLPGTYDFRITIAYVNASNGNSLDAVLSASIKVHVGLGFIGGLVFLVAILATVALVLYKRRTKVPSGEKPPAPEKTPAISAPGATPDLGAKKIRCPECKKPIDEGSVFCAECGARIPEFLRYGDSEPPTA